MFPGWLPEELFFDELPVEHPLPVEHTAVYHDGSTGVIVNGSGAKWQGDWVFIDTGVRLEEGYGTSGQTPVLILTLRQPNVFGVLLVDWFDPPEELRTLAEVTNATEVGVVYTSGASSPTFTPAASGSTPIFTGDM